MQTLSCHCCEAEIGEDTRPGVLVQLPLLPGEKEVAWCGNNCFRKDKNK